jgi:penicillin-binding protein 2
MNHGRLYFFYGLLIIGLLLLVGRLFELQIIFGAKNRNLAEGNRIKKEILPAPRGMIYDRQGKELVHNIPIYRKKVEGDQCEAGKKECFVLIDREEALKMEARGEQQNLRVDIGREYLYKEALTHVLGYLGEANQDEVAKGQFRLGDLVGRGGIEQQYDHLLRGQDGGEIYEVDAQGKKIRQIGRTEPIPGQDLHLSLEADLTKLAWESLEGKSGAVVGSDPKTGQILILTSSPSFDPNLMNQAKDKNASDFQDYQEKLQSLFADPQKPFLNRVLSGAYPPGSTFKIVTATAGLEEGKIDSETLWNDTGEIRVGEYSYKNWYFTQYGRTEGEINVVGALKRSTDTFFYKVGEWVGPTRLSAWAKAFGLGQKTQIDLPGEVEGLVPSPDWKEERGERWFLGNTYHFAIGQGDLLATPLQINFLTNVMASNGRLCQPQVLKSEDKKDNCRDLKLKKETLFLVTEGMKEVCSLGGTAFPFFEFSPQVGCKTGTAEFGDPQDKTHAWFTAFGSWENPELSLTVLIEKGGEGSEVAAPVAKKIMEAYFRDR